MILKNSFNFISEFFNYSSNQIRKIYLSSRIYNKKISRIDRKLIEYKPSPNLLDCLIKYEKKNPAPDEIARYVPIERVGVSQISIFNFVFSF